MAVIHDDVSRRRFLSQAVMGFGLLFGVGSLTMRFIQFLIPAVAAKRLETVLVGNTAKLHPGEALVVDVGRHRLAVLQTDSGPIALSRRCTDLGCLISWNVDRQQFVCPCHQGVFDQTGKNLSGPPPRPLDRYEVVTKGEQLYVRLEA
ncbi:MAG TPA: Rieske (2Fe-2S) protein [Nitrospirales bacterium]|nr:Rieske (2Fe-2S) protein [Nitrospirales bacterium]